MGFIDRKLYSILPPKTRGGKKTEENNSLIEREEEKKVEKRGRKKLEEDKVLHFLSFAIRNLSFPSISILLSWKIKSSFRVWVEIMRCLFISKTSAS